MEDTVVHIDIDLLERIELPHENYVYFPKANGYVYSHDKRVYLYTSFGASTTEFNVLFKENPIRIKVFFDHVFVMTAAYIYVYDHRFRPRSKLTVPVSISTNSTDNFVSNSTDNFVGNPVDFFIDKVGKDFKANYVFNGFQEVTIEFHNGLQQLIYDAHCNYCDVYRDKLYICTSTYGGNQVIEGFVPKNIVRHKYQGFFVKDQIYMYRYKNGNTVFETYKDEVFTNYTFPGKGTIINWENQVNRKSQGTNTAMYIHNQIGIIFQLPSVDL